MKVYTSYFYKIRFFKPYMIPLSTAMYDPKWYHDNQSQFHLFIDKRGVYNGLRLSQLAPGDSCNGLCRGKGCTESPDTCRFLKAYRAQLDSIDFDDIMNKLERVCAIIKDTTHLEEDPIIVLIVHEATTNPCSERNVIREWFKDHSVIVKELDI